MIRGIVALGFAAFVTAGIPAATADVVVSNADVTAASDAGVVTAKFTVTNTAATAVDITPTADAVGCVVTPTSVHLPPRSTSSVTLTLAGCFTDDRSTVPVDVDGALEAGPVKVTGPSTPSDWLPLWFGLAIALVMAVPVGLHGATQREEAVLDGTTTDKGRKARLESYLHVQDIVGARLREMQRDRLIWKDLTRTFPAYGSDSPISNLEAGWSFKDSWVANLTVASGALVALLTSTDVLTALLGEKPAAALGVMTTAGLISAVFIGIANTTLKLVGPKVSDVTVRGLSLSTSLVVLAAGLQVGTLGIAVARAAGHWPLAVGAVMLAVVVGAVLEVYAFRSLGQAVRKGYAGTLPVVQDDAVSGWAATTDWEKDVVETQIRATFADWLVTADEGKHDGSQGEGTDDSGPAVPRGVAPSSPVARPPRSRSRRRSLL